MTVEDFYQAVEGDYEDAINRFQEDTRIARFLKMLPQDDSMDLLAEAIQAADVRQAFCAAHTLKGTSLNLSLMALAHTCTIMADLLRESEVLPEETKPAYEAVRREYARVCEAVKELDGCEHSEE